MLCNIVTGRLLEAWRLVRKEIEVTHGLWKQEQTDIGYGQYIKQLWEK